MIQADRLPIGVDGHIHQQLRICHTKKHRKEYRNIDLQFFNLSIAKKSGIKAIKINHA